MKNKVMISTGDESIFINKKEKTKYMIGSGEHAIFISDQTPTIEEINKRLDRSFKSNIKLRIRSKVLSFKEKRKNKH